MKSKQRKLAKNEKNCFAVRMEWVKYSTIVDPVRLNLSTFLHPKKLHHQIMYIKLKLYIVDCKLDNRIKLLHSTQISVYFTCEFPTGVTYY